MDLNETKLLTFILCSQQIHQADGYAEKYTKHTLVYSLLLKPKCPLVRNEMSSSMRSYCNSSFLRCFNFPSAAQAFCDVLILHLYMHAILFQVGFT